LISETFAKGAENQDLRQALETFQRQQLALQKEVEKLRNEQADLRKRLMEFSASKTRAITPPDAAKRPLKPKRTVQRP
jgi:predicted  nucleic acid-binding Zn-ribbon protein